MKPSGLRWVYREAEVTKAAERQIEFTVRATAGAKEVGASSFPGQGRHRGGQIQVPAPPSNASRTAACRDIAFGYRWIVKTVISKPRGGRVPLSIGRLLR